MRTEVIIWIILAPFGIFLCMGLLGMIGVPDSWIGIIGVLLLIGYLGGIIKIIFQLSRMPAQSLDQFFGDRRFQIRPLRIFGREYEGRWANQMIKIRYLCGFGGIPSRLSFSDCPNLFIEFRKSNDPKVIAQWLDKVVQ